MFTKVTTKQYAQVQSLFAPLDYFLTVGSIFAGHTPGDVYVDGETAVTFFSHRLFLAGGGEETAVHNNLAQLLEDVVIPTTQKYGKDAIIVHPTQEWLPHLPRILERFKPIQAMRLYYRLDARKHSWQSKLPEGYQLRPVDAELLADTSITNLDFVTDEMVSERPSVTDFLNKSFGVAAVYQNEVVGWCMSEYNTGHRCELGIETAEAHRRKGLAMGLGTAVIQQALANNIHDIGWTCWEKNHPSRATGKKLGFACVHELPVWIIVF
ncbi:MAG: GNAT family N-acetyltransferase [Chloroflexi bacterium]|nr:MAG: GNAT family N-acetyltransferase [Chloroflexota bacterium]